MKNLKNIYGNFKDWLNHLDTKEYWENFDIHYKKYLLEKNINKKKFQSEIELKKYLQDLINFFKIEALGNEIAEKIWVNYYQEISNIFHEKVDQMISRKYKWDDIYEDFIKEEREKLQIWFNKSIADTLEENLS